MEVWLAQRGANDIPKLFPRITTYRPGQQSSNQKVLLFKDWLMAYVK